MLSTFSSTPYRRRFGRRRYAMRSHGTRCPSRSGSAGPPTPRATFTTAVLGRVRVDASLAQKLAGEGAATATVAIDPAPFRSVLPVPWSALRSGAPILGNPANAGRSVSLTFEQFSYAW
ncbi:hypothetical protein ACQPWY_06215 [Pseudonocardia xinjiangensis]|uniref:hypothetical protein n=1 Tax=Pseudonocardia xinjiangensis TaxID=75289 RepID=UPI003D91380E